MTSPEGLAATHAAAFAPERGWTAEEFRGLLDRPTTVFAGDARAFVVVTAVGDEAEILTIATHPDHRRGGRARGLLRKLPQHLPKTTCDLFLEVASDNAAARALYASEGFAEVGSRKGYYRRAPGETVDALILRKALQTA